MAGGRTKKYVRADFSGGIIEATGIDEFDGTQNPVVKGFVLESETSLRSQWGAFEAPSLPNGRAVSSFHLMKTDSGVTWLLVIDSGGAVWYADAPRSVWSMEGVEWARLQTDGGADAQVFMGSRFVCDVPWGKNLSKYKSGVLVQKPEATLSNDPTTDTIRAGYVVYLKADNTPTMTSIGSAYPTLLNPSTGVYTGKTDVMPWARVGTMWGDYLVLADVFGPKNGKPAEFSRTNEKRFTNGLWISATPSRIANGGVEQFRVDQWDPRYGFLTIGTPETRIVGLQPIDAGLLVFTTSAADGDGLFLLRGYPPGLSPENETSATFKLEPVRGGLAALPTTPTATSLESSKMVFWPEGGTTVLLDQRGSVWSTNGAQVTQLDRYGPQPVAAPLPGDGLAPFGQFLVLSRRNRLFAFRLLGTAGTWTELVLPADAGPISGMAADGDCLYFLQGFSGGDTKLWRFSAAAASRGTAATYVNGQLTYVPLDLVLGTATVGSDEYNTELWHRTSVALSVPKGGSGTVKTVRTVAGPVLPLGTEQANYGLPVAPSFVQPVYRTVIGPDRVEVVVPAGIGRAAEASAVVTLTGDVSIGSVRLESVSSVMKRG